MLYIFSIIAMMVLSFPAIAASAGDSLTRISCPLQWTDPDGKPQPLSWTQASFDPDASFGPDDEKVLPPYDTSLMLDCAYGHPSGHLSRYDGAFSTLRVTLLMPGHVKRCRGWMGGGAKYRVHGLQMNCWTQADPGAPLAEAKIIPAEPVTGATTLLGLGLDKSREQLAEVATRQGFVCADGESAELACVRGEERVAIRFHDGRSVEVEQAAQRPQGQRNALYRNTILRFGLNRQYLAAEYLYPDERYGQQVWQSPGSFMRIAMVVGDNEVRVRLTDLSKTGVGPR
jgi:hypothetical protein